jgi:hypothetical protein
MPPAAGLWCFVLQRTRQRPNGRGGHLYATKDTSQETQSRKRIVQLLESFQVRRVFHSIIAYKNTKRRHGQDSGNYHHRVGFPCRQAIRHVMR